MKAIQAHPQQGLDGLTSVDLPDPGDPGRDAIRVRVHATSLNFHDLGVVTGRLPAAATCRPRIVWRSVSDKAKQAATASSAIASGSVRGRRG